MNYFEYTFCNTCSLIKCTKAGCTHKTFRKWMSWIWCDSCFAVSRRCIDNRNYIHSVTNGDSTIQMQLSSAPLCLLIYQLVLSLHQLWILAPSLDKNGDDDSVCRHHCDIFACTTTAESGGKWTLDGLWWGHASTSDHEKWSLQQRNNYVHCTSSLIQILFTPIWS